MHRVELKEALTAPYFFVAFGFLMHRVELKVHSPPPLHLLCLRVPNAPCGVERTIAVRDYTTSV